MPSRSLALAAVALTLGGCAATTPPPRFQAVSPADPDAPESATPPAVPVLTGTPEVGPATKPTPTSTPTPHHHHGGRA